MSIGNTKLVDGEGDKKVIDVTGIKTWPLQVKFRHVALVTVSFPLTGFIFGVFYAVYVDAEAASRTDCGARNYLPSASAAIGGFKLSETFWKFCIGIHAAPRFAVAGMYNGYLKSVLPKDCLLKIRVACILYITEIIFLIALTFVTSVENYVLHQRFFIVFMMASTLYMTMLTCLLTKYRTTEASIEEKKSLFAKKMLLCTFLTSCALATYFFVRHRVHCENGIYTIFSFLEYIVILSNMSYHMTAYWDFYNRVVTLGPVKHD